MRAGFVLPFVRVLVLWRDQALGDGQSGWHSYRRYARNIFSIMFSCAKSFSPECEAMRGGANPGRLHHFTSWLMRLSMVEKRPIEVEGLEGLQWN